MDLITDWLRNYDLVVIDDLRVQNFSPAKQENLYLIINRAYLDNKRLLITTNFEIEELEKIDVSITDRLVEMAELMKFEGESFRK
jgi:DNA replication protein DnaC